MDHWPLVSFGLVSDEEGSGGLARCIESIRGLDYPAERIEVFVSGCAAPQDSLGKIQQQFPWVQRLGRANYCLTQNLTIAASRGTFIALLNHPVVLDPGWLRSLLDVMRPKLQIGAAMGRILREDRATVFTTGLFEKPDFYWGYQEFGVPDQARPERPAEPMFLVGTAVLFRRACLEDIGGLDGDFDRYYEDVDVSFRCRHRGWQLAYTPTSVAYYDQGAFREGEWGPTQHRNRLLLIAKRFPERLPDVVQRWMAARLLEAGAGVPMRGGDVVDPMREAFLKLVREHPRQRAAPILDQVFQGLDRVVGRTCHSWSSYYARRLQQLLTMQRHQRETPLCSAPRRRNDVGTVLRRFALVGHRRWLQGGGRS